jgi:hypothetical protein
LSNRYDAKASQVAQEQEWAKIESARKLIEGDANLLINPKLERRKSLFRRTKTKIASKSTFDR